MFIGTPRGAFTPILNLFLELPPRVFLGILSEYQALKYGPELVNKNFGDFLVTGYIYPPIRGCTPAYAQGFTSFFLGNHKNIATLKLGYSLRLNWYTLKSYQGTLRFCQLGLACEPLKLFFMTRKKKPPTILLNIVRG